MPHDSPSPRPRPQARGSGRLAPGSRPSWPVIPPAAPSPPSRDHEPGPGSGTGPGRPARHRAGERPPSLLAEISETALQNSMDSLADFDLDVQRLVGHVVELPEHLVNGVVTGWLTRGARICDRHVLAGVHHRPTLHPRAHLVRRAIAPSEWLTRQPASRAS